MFFVPRKPLLNRKSHLSRGIRKKCIILPDMKMSRFKTVLHDWSHPSLLIDEAKTKCKCQNNRRNVSKSQNIFMAVKGGCFRPERVDMTEIEILYVFFPTLHLSHPLENSSENKSQIKILKTIIYSHRFKWSCCFYLHKINMQKHWFFLLVGFPMKNSLKLYCRKCGNSLAKRRTSKWSNNEHELLSLKETALLSL